MVDRFDFEAGGFLGSSGAMVPDPHGDYVRVSDYATLQAERDDLAKKLAEATDFWKEIDLSKAVRHSHPDIIPHERTYLVKVYGGWFFGPFTQQWYGLYFPNWGGSGCQFDTPGWNSSRWERVIEIDPDRLPAARIVEGQDNG